MCVYIQLKHSWNFFERSSYFSCFCQCFMYSRFLRDLQRGLRMKRKEATISSIHGMDTSKLNSFPYSSLKLLGGLQIGVGGACILLGIIDLFLFLYVAPDYGSSTLTALTIASLPIWCGLWVNCLFYSFKGNRRTFRVGNYIKIVLHLFSKRGLL